jgi:CPA1 family monovalent cation:H+ antiporter
MGMFMIITLLVIVSAVYSYLNARVFRLPGTIGIVSIAVAVSAITIVADKLNPGAAGYLNSLAKNINFSGSVLNIMLGFLLFAGAFNLNNRRLKREMLPVLILSTVSVIVSTLIFGLLFYWVTILFHEHISLIFCMLFGALISPTDPVAVGAVIKGSRLPQNLETIISGWCYLLPYWN